MSYYSKKFRSLELKWLLPKANKTRKKEKYIEKLEEKYNKTLKKWANLVLIKANIKDINLLEGDPDDEIKRLENSKNELKEKINNLKEECRVETNFYKVIFSTIANQKEEGFLEETDIQIEYLEEYIYLILLYYYETKDKNIINNFFKSEKEEEAFFNLVYKKYPDPEASVFKTLETGKAEGELFFSLFGIHFK